VEFVARSSGMTEREKMLAGELYLAADPELVALRVRARELTARLNALPPSASAADRDVALREVLGHVGEQAYIEPPFFCDYGVNIRLGRAAYLNTGCVVLDCGLVTIGDQVKFGPCVQVYAAHHPIDPTARRTDPRELASPITIGNNVWVGGGTVILPNVTIGDDTVIGAGSVVTKSLPARVVAVGNPCRVIRQL
jgi:maltose O-acetyltransferase